ncbi:MAG: hypothetical protein MJK12_17455 [Colwellia sp.]|nr:hypothetical protein [Colwellia sp.]
MTNFVIIIWLLSITSFTIFSKENNQAQHQDVEPLIVRYNQSALFSDNEKYYASLLKLALEETRDDFGSYQLQAVDIAMVQQRSITMLSAAQHIDVIWTMTTKQREQTLQAVYIPLLKGLMGYRVFLIRQGEQKRFTDITELSELKLMLAGQGINWPDSQILRANNIPLVDALGKSLYEMLARHRFDYFPRALTEISKELVQHPNVVMESHLMLQYTAPLYFFVNKNNSTLARRLELGLSRAINNGKFDRLFYRLRAPESLITQLNIEKRLIFKLENPLLSEKTKQLQANSALWLLP